MRTVAALVAVFACLAWQPDVGGAQTPAATPAPAVPDDRPSFDAFLDGVKTEALARGITEATVSAALAGVEPLPVVIERDRSQAEHVVPFDVYLKQRLSARTVQTARRFASQNGSLLKKVSATYGVPDEVIVSTWGIESNFGRFSGVRPTVPALATLAYDPRRSTYFREELFNALTIVDQGHIELSRLKGSWAGAMGQPQFMPSSYVKYAQDFDGDGRRDIWSSKADVFASIANYLKGHGWIEGERWGRRVQVPETAAGTIEQTVPRRSGSCRAMSDMFGPLPVTRWRELGVRLGPNAPLPASDMAASLISLPGASFLVYNNYDALLGYNCSHAYALSLALLSERIAAPAPPPAPARKPAPKRSRR